MKDKETIVHGKIENGTIQQGDKLCIAPHGGLAQVLGLLDGKGNVVKYAAPGENVQIRLNVADDDQIQRGYVLCHRDQMMPVTEIFEAEMEILELLDYKPIMSKGYTCIMHIHTYNDEVTIKDILQTEEISDKGVKSVKQKPKFAKSNQKIIVRIAPKTPISLEKFETIQQMGRFTLRDEGKTISVGKILKYKPYVKGAVTAQKPATAAAEKAQIVTTDSSAKEDMVYDMETGELKLKEKEL